MIVELILWLINYAAFYENVGGIGKHIILHAHERRQPNGNMFSLNYFIICLAM